MTEETRYAEDANYWQTTVSPYKSQGEIMELLDRFGAANMAVTQGKAGENLAWLIRFEWRGATYRFTFTPLPCRSPDKVSSFSGTRRAHDKQVVYQMGRIAVHFVKAILTAAEAHPHALFGFVELPEAGTYPGGLPVTAGELDVRDLVAALPPIDVIGAAPQLQSGIIEGEVQER
jgi:hypothetical protein